MSKARRPGLSELAAIAAISMMVLALEVALTRAFSVLLRFHYVFLAVSVATCGLGLGGVVDYVLRGRRTAAVLGWSALAAGVLGPAGVVVLFASPLSAYLTSIAVLAACCLPGFMAAGVYLSRAFSTWGKYSGWLYYADLTGAATAAAGIIVLLQLGGAVNAAIACGALGAFAAALSFRRLVPIAVAVAVCGGLVFAALANSSLRWVDLPTLPLAGDPNAKPLYQELGDPSSGARVIYSEWNAFARTDVVVYAGPDGKVPPDADLYVYTDGEVPTNIAAYHGNLRELAARYEGFLGLYAFLAQRPKDVMLLGPGGGLDIWLALIVGAKNIKGAEVNPSIPDIVRRFRDYAGPVYDFSNVDISVAEGRSYLRRTSEKFDMIYMALTKTATTATTSMALVESYVYTVEAFRDYYRHLKPGGAFAFVCQASPLLVRETLAALQALQEEGRSRQEAAASLVIASASENGPFIGPYRHLLMVFHDPLTPERARKLGELAVGWGLEPGYFPGAYEPAPLKELADPDKDIAELVKDWNTAWFGYGRAGLNMTPCTDDKPFVVDLTWGVPKPLARFLAGTAGVCFALMILTAAFVVKTPGPRAAAWPLYFACLGMGFMLVEIVLIQMFTLYLGYPVLSLAVLLFALLLGAGVGSLLSQRARLKATPRAVAGAVFLLVVLLLALRATAPALFAATLGWNVKLRSLLSLLVVFPIGLVMGIPFPAGLRRAIDEQGAEVVPWAWAVNGVASVVGSAAAMACAKLLGFSTTLATGLAVYVLAAATILLAHTSMRSTSAQEGLFDE